MSSAASRMFKAARRELGNRKPRSERFLPPLTTQNIPIENEINEIKEVEPSTIIKDTEIQKPPVIKSSSPTATSQTPTVTKEIKGGETKPEVQQSKPLKLKAVKPHIQMIKFRKGSLIPKPALPESTVSPVVSAIPATSSQSNSWQPEQVVNLEWWQTPTKFKRRLVDDLEADLINSGGADKVYH